MVRFTSSNKETNTRRLEAEVSRISVLGMIVCGQSELVIKSFTTTAKPVVVKEKLQIIQETQVVGRIVSILSADGNWIRL
jgi:hypothetical protein